MREEGRHRKESVDVQPASTGALSGEKHQNVTPGPHANSLEPGAWQSYLCAVLYLKAETQMQADLVKIQKQTKVFWSPSPQDQATYKE